MSQKAKDLIRNILDNGTPQEKRALFSFTVEEDNAVILKKFELFTRYNYSRYFTHKSSPEHTVEVENLIRSYKGETNVIEIAFRGFGKTTLKKLFDTFVILNDTGNFRKYIKVLTKDGKNSRQVVTDVYNMIVEVKPIYGDIFEKEGDKKREETMSVFTTKEGVKYSSGTIGQTQRGHVQDAYRPDWVWFDDLEDRESVSSLIITEGIINRADEAITGLSFDGTYVITANYISDAGTVQWFLNKKDIIKHIVPITNGDTPTWDRYTPEILKKLKDDAEDWAGEYLCVKPDTKILTKDGWEEISSLSVGDKVISHLEKEQEILKVFENTSDDLLDITVNGESVTITKNHPVRTIRGGVEKWVEAGDLIVDDLVVVIPHGKLTP